MEITRETRAQRWLIMVATWIFVGAVAVWHMRTMSGYIKLLDTAAPQSQPTPLRRPLPVAFADSFNWVRYALAATEQGKFQFRYTDIDNAPRGREVHWSSLFTQLVAAAGRLEQQRHGGSYAQATENALAWFNLPLLLVSVIPLSAWFAARSGAGAGVLVALGMVGLHSFYDPFVPNYVDHHGLLNATALGLVAGAFFMGGGWWRKTGQPGALLPTSPSSARRAAVVGALAGAIGMWVSAASTIPLIALIGVGALLVAYVFARAARADGATFEPSVWQWWGRVGAIASLVFYCVEYAPSHLSWRLEVNHPVHALAWWGGAELVAVLIRWRIEGETGKPAIGPLILFALAIAAAPLAIIIGGTSTFAVRDPFVADLRHTVSEGMSFRAAIAAFGPEYARQYLIHFVLLAVTAWTFIQASRARMPFALLAGLYFALVAMSCWENRWWLTASAPFLVLCVAITSIFAARRGPVFRWAFVLAISAVLVPSGALGGARMLQKRVEANTVHKTDISNLLYRDIAAVLLASQPTGEIILLASPDASTGTSYYGDFKTLGTLYWENTEGLKAAAAIYCAERDEDAREKMRARGVTHLVVTTRASFVDEYFRLWRPDVSPEEVKRTFGYRVFVSGEIPSWLKPISYRPPGILYQPDNPVLLLQVGAEQPAFDAFWNVANAQAAAGLPELAEKNYRHAIGLVGVEERAARFKIAADYVYQYRAHAAAIRLYRAGLALGDNMWLASSLAWVLCTAPDDSLRNGREALQLIESAWRQKQDDVGLLNTFAAALAENGRFADAVAVANRAVELFRAGGGNAPTIALLQQRVDAYRSNRPWRD